MAVLTQWLEKIILLILLATLLEMVLPSMMMQRYVKLVMGLLILLSIINPVLSILQSDFTEDKLALKFFQSQSDSSSDFDLKRIKDYGNKLMRQNSQDTQGFVKKQMEALIKAKVEENFGIKVREAHVSISEKEMDNKESYPAISAVQLVLDKDYKLSSPTDAGQREITPIQPITIQLDNDSTQAAPAVSTPSDLSGNERKMITDVVQYVAQTWSIDQNLVQANLERKAEEGSR